VETNDCLYLLDPRNGKTKIFDLTNDLYRLRVVVDRHGNTLQYGYDSDLLHALQPVCIEDDFGRFIELAYTNIYDPPNCGYIEQVTDHAGREVRLVYELGADSEFPPPPLREIVDVMGGTNRFAYTNVQVGAGTYRGVMTEHRTPAGNTPWWQVYGSAHLYPSDIRAVPAVDEQIDAYGNTFAFHYDTNALTVAVAWPNGGTNVFRHGGRGSPPQAVTAPGGEETLFDLDDRNRFTALADPTGEEIAFAYDPVSAPRHPRKAQGHLDDRRPFADHRWTQPVPATLHPARKRP